MTAARSDLLELDPRRFAERFPYRPFTIGHRLCGHPLFELDRILELARALPERSVEYNAGDLPVSQDPAATPRTGLSAEETIRRIAEHRSWMVLKNVEQDPAYAALQNACIDELAPLSSAATPGLRMREGFLFVSSPGAVTPYHMDDEHNFLLQVRGSKIVSTWDGRDPAVLGPLELERFFQGGHRNLAFREELEALATAFTLQPGEGLHIPWASPHWVKVGPEVSVSFSITFRSRPSQRAAAVHWLNGRLRARGFTPRPYGSRPLADSVKHLAAGVARRALRSLGRG